MDGSSAISKGSNMKRIIVSLCIVSLFLISCTTKSINNNEFVKQNTAEKPAEELPAESVLKLVKPENLYIIGIVIEVIENEGTFSEVRYFLLADDKGVKTILFNEKGFSEGFKAWIGKDAIVQGYKDTGFIGFKRVQKTGVVVESISAVK